MKAFVCVCPLAKDVKMWALALTKTLKALVDKESPDLVIMGKQSIDDDSNQTGQMLAALLGWAQGTFASKVEITDLLGMFLPKICVS